MLQGEELEKELVKLSKKSNTQVIYSSLGEIVVKLYTTEIFSLDSRTKTIVVATGDYSTKTTYRRINECFGVLGINCRVSKASRIFNNQSEYVIVLKEEE